MRISWVLLILLISTNASAFLVEALSPSPLSNCSMRGWVQMRLPEKDSLEFIKFDDGCFAAFKIDPATPQISEGWRAELEDPKRVPHWTSFTYEFSTFLPADLKGADTPNLVIAQWHDNKIAGDKAQRPPLSLRLRDGKITIPLFHQQYLEKNGFHAPGITLYSDDAVYNKWMMWKFKIYWAKNNLARVEVFLNGSRIVYYRGFLGYPGDATAPYFKLGIYTTQKFNRELKVYHTGFRRTYFGNEPRDKDGNLIEQPRRGSR
jgi:hypothetical protein